MKLDTFLDYAKAGYTCIPIFKELLADIDTPLTLFSKLADAPYTYLFESVQGGEKWARYSILGLAASERIEVRGQHIKHIDNDTISYEADATDPLRYIAELQKQYRTPNLAELPKFQGGFVGYFAYDCIHLFEPKLQKKAQIDQLDIPDIILLLSKEVVVIDNLSGKIYLVVIADLTKLTNADLQNDTRLAGVLDEATAKLKAISDTLQRPHPVPYLSLNDENTLPDVTYATDEQTFLNQVKTIKDYITEGDAFQVVVSQQMSTDFDQEPLNLYRALRTLNPSPYMYYLDLGDFHIVGASPEVLVRFEDGMAEVRPIAGTRKRGKTPAEDDAITAELLADPKERAEHLMLIDLGRNDIGRIAKPGKVEVTESFVIERYSHVIHIVSNVAGEVKEDLNALDVLKSAFPAGTLSGAPKFRAMDIITELEPVKRGIYGGAIGYLSWDGNMDTAITIRTAVIKNKKAYIQAGAGVVYDSVPESEWQETLNKSQAILKAISLINSVDTKQKN